MPWRTGQTRVQKCPNDPPARIQQNEIDPSFAITLELPLDKAADVYDIVKHKLDGRIKVVLQS